MIVRIAFVFLIVCLATTGCSRKLAGEYKYASKHLVIKLTVNKDSSFIYREFDEVSTESFTKGFWEVKKDTLFLTSQGYTRADSLKIQLLGGNFFKLARFRMLVRKRQLFQPESQIILEKVKS